MGVVRGRRVKLERERLEQIDFILWTINEKR